MRFLGKDRLLHFELASLSHNNFPTFRARVVMRLEHISDYIVRR